jgi:hypothetical protein
MTDDRVTLLMRALETNSLCHVEIDTVDVNDDEFQKYLGVHNIMYVVLNKEVNSIASVEYIGTQFALARMLSKWWHMGFSSALAELVPIWEGVCP